MRELPLTPRIREDGLGQIANGMVGTRSLLLSYFGARCRGWACIGKKLKSKYISEDDRREAEQLLKELTPSG